MGNEYYNPRHVSGLMPLLWVSILFGVGIVLGDVLLNIVGVGMWIIIACLVVSVGLLLVKKSPNVSFVMILLSVVAFGGMRISVNEDRLEYEDRDEKVVHNVGRLNARDEDKKEETCEILVMNKPVEHGKVIHFDGFVYKGNELEGRKVRFSLLRDTISGAFRSVQIGSFLRSRVDWSLLEEWYHTTSHFSYVRWQKSRGFTRRGFIGIGKWSLLPDNWSEIYLFREISVRMMMFRQDIADRLHQRGLGEEAYGVAAAMVLGDKSSLSRKIRDEYNKAGASHILALSGMHLMIIYMMLGSLFGRIRRRMELLILCILWAYVMFAGMPVSLVRAATMLSVYKIISMFGVNQHQLNVIGFAALVILIANPQSLWDVGFQMSFMAVLFIVLYAPYFSEMKPARWKIKKKSMSSLGKWKQYRYLTYRGVWNMASVSIAAQLGTLPLSCYYFERIPCYFLISNFIVIPAAVIIICLMIIMIAGCVLDMCLGWCGLMIDYVGRVLECVVWVLNKSQRIISYMPGSSVEGIDVNMVQVVLLYIIICGSMALVWKLRHRVAESKWNVPG